MSEPIDNKEKLSYRGIFKATSLFGGVQVYQIIIDIIRSKIIAVLLGPFGIGIQGLYTSATQLIQHITSFGLSTSAVRDVASAYGSGDSERVGKVVLSLRKLVWITGLLGTAVVVLLSPVLSQTSFGDYNHILPFIVISITLLLAQLSAGQKVILQGTRRLKALAKASAMGATIGLIIAAPLYYWLGVDGIIPNIVISAITTLLLSWYYSKQVVIQKSVVSNKEVWAIGKTMIIMGIAMSISHILSFASSYALRACIRMWDGVDAVGLFTAGYLLMNQYTGLVFKAMGTDFYPRLSSANNDNEKCRKLMNQQGEIGILILTPLLIISMVFIPFVVMILYSEEFLNINTYIVWCSMGMLFKMASWSISYVFVAKGESKLFMIIESSAAIYTLILNVVAYRFYGLLGLGVSFSISYLIYLIQVLVIANKYYAFTFEKSFLKLFFVESLILSVSVACIWNLPSLWRYIIGTLLILISLVISFRGLDERIGIKNYIVNKLNNKAK